MNEEKENNKICAFCGKEKSLGGFHEHRIGKHKKESRLGFFLVGADVHKGF